MDFPDIRLFCKTDSSGDYCTIFDWLLINVRASNFGQWLVPGTLVPVNYVIILDQRSDSLLIFPPQLCSRQLACSWRIRVRFKVLTLIKLCKNSPSNFKVGEI